MSGKPTLESQLAVRYVISTGATPAQAADIYGMSTRGVQHALQRAGKSQPVGRPATKRGKKSK